MSPSILSQREIDALLMSLPVDAPSDYRRPFPLDDPPVVSSLGDAIRLAVLAHHGQIRKGDSGDPYILHPMRVMMQFRGDLFRTVAILHDVIEDCEGWTLDRFKGVWRGDSSVVEALDAISRRTDESHNEYIKRLCESSILAMMVKVRDIEDNLNDGEWCPEGLAKRYRNDLETIMDAVLRKFDK